MDNELHVFYCNFYSCQRCKNITALTLPQRMVHSNTRINVNSNVNIVFFVFAQMSTDRHIYLTRINSFKMPFFLILYVHQYCK